MKIRVQQLNPVIGAIAENSSAVIGALKQAEEAGIDLLILPELVVCGYPPMDLLERRDFRERIYGANRDIIQATGETGIVFGTVTENSGSHSRPCFNSALLAAAGTLHATVHKTLLPTYDIFDDLRYFDSGEEFSCVEWKGRKLGITICEDIWHNENEIQYHTYPVNPAAELAGKGAEAIINISASPYTRNKPAYRLKMLQKHAGDLGLPLFYANQTGANTEIIFDGDSMILDAGGEVVARTPLFGEAHADAEWSGEGGPVNIGPPPVPQAEPVENLFRALVTGVRDYLEKSRLPGRLVLGLSGGIDSALVACIAAEAVGGAQVTGLTMPTRFSSGGSITDSEALAQNLEMELHEIAIDPVFRLFVELLEPVIGEAEGVTLQNLQPRIRQILLMAWSNSRGNLLLATGNKSEAATGYSTLYGDMAGAIGVISDLYKDEVYAMARWLNRSWYGREIIPPAILEKAPSAELRPGQLDSDALPDYSLLDPILRRYLESGESAGEIVEAGFDRETVAEVIRRVDRSEFKRFQAPPGLKVSRKSFGTGRRWPVVQQWTENQL